MRPSGGHQRGLPGAEPGAQSDGGGERLRQPPAAGVLGLINQRNAAAHARPARHVPGGFQARHPGRPALVGNQQMVEIVKALARNAKVLILDEPTSSLTLQEAARLFARLEQLKKQGLAIIYVSHHLEEIFQISDRVAVLRDGKLVGVRPDHRNG